MAAARRHAPVRAGVLSATGQRFPAEHVTVKGTMGEGSYGQVFEVCSLALSVAVGNCNGATRR